MRNQAKWSRKAKVAIALPSKNSCLNSALWRFLLVLIIHLQAHYRAFLRWSIIAGEDQSAKTGHPATEILTLCFGEAPQ